ncbi:MAG: eL32 family ribosomal protein [Nanoarchaeota archaeon]
MTRFLRRIWSRYPKLGKGRKKKQKWRKPKGRDNKMREKRRGYPVVVSVGYKKKSNERKKIKIISNLNDLNNLQKNEIVVVGKIGKKKKIEVLKKALEMKISIQNVNVEKFLKKLEKKESSIKNKSEELKKK